MAFVAWIVSRTSTLSPTRTASPGARTVVRKRGRPRRSVVRSARGSDATKQSQPAQQSAPAEIEGPGEGRPEGGGDPRAGAS